jgi:site-specific DNA recombinase
MVTRCVDDLHNLLDESSITERKSFIRSFVKEIKFTGDEVLLTYTMPLPPEGTLEEKMPVLYSVRPSGAGGIRTPYLLRAKQTFSQVNYGPVLTSKL